MDNRVPNYLSTLIIILLLSIFLLPRLGSHLRTEDILTPLIAIVTTDFIVIFMWKQKSQVLGIYQTIIYILYIFYICLFLAIIIHLWLFYILKLHHHILKSTDWHYYCNTRHYHNNCNEDN